MPKNTASLSRLHRKKCAGNFCLHFKEGRLLRKTGAIGLFDSGIGGLTVAVEVYRQLPAESTIYFGDTAHVPYGSRNPGELYRFASRIVDFLEGEGAKYIIFACNTSSSLSLPILQERKAVPMIGLIKPGVAAALQKTVNRRIGVIATEATVKSGAYERELKRQDENVQVFCQAASRLVPLVEAGETGTPAAAEAVREYLFPLKEAGIDTLILGCTHYPFLKPLIAGEMGPGVQLVDPAAATVEEAGKELQRLGLAAGGPAVPEHRFVVSGDPAAFQKAARRFLGRNIGPVGRVEL
ncbi:MAG: glutamate racemase [Pelotomaculum sp.]|nr:glutamate racemase [Pelotomaculum sp.]